MHKLTFGLATLVIVGGVGGALADSSDHGSNDSLKWEMREMQRMQQYSGVVPRSHPRFGVQLEWLHEKSRWPEEWL